MPGSELAIQSALHPTGLRITVPITVAGRVTLLMVLDLGSPASAISPAAAQTRCGFGLLASPVRGVYRLTALSVQGQVLPDLHVQVLVRLARLARWEVGGTPLEVDGLLGLDFLGKFVDIHFNVPSMRLRLIAP